VRLPWSKIYRAFPELDPFGDEECERFVDRARTQRLITGPAVFAGIIAYLLACFAAFQARAMFPTRRVAVGDEFPVEFAIFIIFTVCAAALTGLFVRDRLLIRAIRDRVTLARCPACRYSLLGLQVRTDVAGGHRVRCPECGAEHILGDIGIAPADLIPREPS
jgi:hypothetical protein